KYNHALAGLRPAQTMPARITSRRIRGDDAMVRGALPSGSTRRVRDLRADGNDSEARCFHAFSLRAVPRIAHRRNSGVQFWADIKERRFANRRRFWVDCL